MVEVSQESPEKSVEIGKNRPINRPLIGGIGQWGEAEAKGLILPGSWRRLPRLAVDYLGDLRTEVGIFGGHGTHALGTVLEHFMKLTTVRNPWRCDKDRVAKVHESVFDRMQGLPGWVPQQHCCEHTLEKWNDAASLQQVSNRHYDEAKVAFDPNAAHPHWLKVTVGELKKAPNTDRFDKPEFYLIVTGWFSEKAKPENKPVPMGCCHRQIFHPKQPGTANFCARIS